jgi:hypothetical protein
VQMQSEDENIVDFVVEVLKYKKNANIEEDWFVSVEEDDDEDVKFWVLFRKKRGPKQDFVKIFKNFRFFCKRLNNTDELEDESNDE